MILKRLDLTHFRCFELGEIEFDSRCNLIVGPNGSGKTSILESIYLLGSGRSFKSAAFDGLIQNGSTEFVVLGRFLDPLESTRTIGIRFGSGQKEIRVNGRNPSSLAELAKSFPVQVIDPNVHHLLEGGPRRRRMFLDWGVFHVEQQFHESWLRFNRALKQRNVQLKSGRSEFSLWDNELATHGSAVTESRLRYLDALRQFLSEMGTRLLGKDVTVEYSQGWKRGITFSEALIEARVRDRSKNTSTVGPHRADLVLKVDGHPAKEHVSRGQQKVLACCLLLAQQKYLASLSSQAACLLLDDPAAELDVDNLGKLLEVVDELPVQLIATSLNSLNLPLFENAKKFHVEHGSIKPMA